jgi:CheY-like chemotaxis protein
MKKKILIYDDEKEILEVCKYLLEDTYELETRTFCKNIVEEVVEIMPDLILIDIRMPEIDGMLATISLKENVLTKHIGVLLFSASNLINQIAAETKADGFIEKPFNIATFVQTIEKHSAHQFSGN